MTYLEDVLAATAATKRRQAKVQGNIGSMIAVAAQRKAAQAAAASRPAASPVGGGGVVAGPHSMGDGHNHSSQKAVNGLNAKFKSALDRMIADSGGKISVGSGYRSLAEQKVLYDRYKSGDPRQKAPAAAPGKSNHNYGTAADLKYGPGGKEFAHANAGKYGLVFPMSYEPWHVESINAKEYR